MANQITIHYDELETIGSRFAQESQEIGELHASTNAKVRELHAQGWIGEASDAFYAEMEERLIPALKRLADALHLSGAVTGKIGQTFHTGEETATEPMKTGRFADAAPSAAAAARSSAQGSADPSAGNAPDASFLRAEGGAAGGGGSSGSASQEASRLQPEARAGGGDESPVRYTPETSRTPTGSGATGGGGSGGGSSGGGGSPSGLKGDLSDLGAKAQSTPTTEVTGGAGQGFSAPSMPDAFFGSGSSTAEAAGTQVPPSAPPAQPEQPGGSLAGLAAGISGVASGGVGIAAGVKAAKERSKKQAEENNNEGGDR